LPEQPKQYLCECFPRPSFQRRNENIKNEAIYFFLLSAMVTSTGEKTSKTKNSEN
jgi:hypothetical protein